MGIPFDYYEHPEAPTIEIAAQFYRGEGTTLCKNLFFRNHKGNRHYLVIMDSRHAMDIHDMEHRLHQGKLSFASPERMMKYLGVRPGSVSLFTLVNDQNQVTALKFRDDGLNFAVDGNYNGACASAANYNAQGYVIGEMTLVVDRNLLNAEKVSFHPNDNRASLVITRDDMLRFIREVGNPYEVVDLYDPNC